MTEIVSPKELSPERPRVQVGNLDLDSLTENEVVEIVRKSWTEGRGGSIVPVNIDVARAAAHKAALAQLISAGSLVVADGMPLVWASRIQGDALPERIAGSSLMYSLSEAAAVDGRSVFLLGGADGVPAKAADELRRRFTDLRIAGADSPPFGFDRTDEGIQETIAGVTAAAPDLVFVGLGFPRQEQLIERLQRALPAAWYLGCGGGIPMAAGMVSRASPLMQRAGLEWAHRLALEPRRLARRYLRDDLPFAIGLLTQSGVRRFARRTSASARQDGQQTGDR